MAGLQLKLRGVDGYLKDHLEPKCHLVESRKIRGFANSLIDVSDGLASEVNHICDKSNVGAIVYGDKVPLSATTCESAEKLGDKPLDYALNGGEDFKLLFTIEKEKTS